MFFDVNLKRILDIENEDQSRPGNQRNPTGAAQSSRNTEFLEGLVLRRVADMEQTIEQRKVEEQREVLQAKELARHLRDYEASPEVKALMRYLSITQESCPIWSPDQSGYDLGSMASLPGEYGILWEYSSKLTLTEKGFVLNREKNFLSRKVCRDYQAKEHFLDRHGDPIENPGALTRLCNWLGFIKKGQSLPIEPLKLFINQGLTMEKIISGVERECYRTILTPQPGAAPAIPAYRSLNNQRIEMWDSSNPAASTYDSGHSSDATQESSSGDSPEAHMSSARAKLTTSIHPLRQTSFRFVNGDS